jgi:hypothetical protein
MLCYPMLCYCVNVYPLHIRSSLVLISVLHYRKESYRIIVSNVRGMVLALISRMGISRRRRHLMHYHRIQVHIYSCYILIRLAIPFCHKFCPLASYAHANTPSTLNFMCLCIYITTQFVLTTVVSM